MKVRILRSRHKRKQKRSKSGVYRNYTSIKDLLLQS